MERTPRIGSFKCMWWNVLSVASWVVHLLECHCFNKPFAKKTKKQQKTKQDQKKHTRNNDIWFPQYVRVHFRNTIWITVFFFASVYRWSSCFALWFWFCSVVSTHSCVIMLKLLRGMRVHVALPGQACLQLSNSGGMWKPHPCVCVCVAQHVNIEFAVHSQHFPLPTAPSGNGVCTTTSSYSPAAFLKGNLIH